MNDHIRNLRAEDAEAFARSVGQALRRGQGHAMPGDITARLAAARAQALALHQEKPAQNSIGPTQTTRSAGARRFSWWQRLLAAVPIAAAGAGVAFMQGAVSDDGLTETIVTDIRILSGEVPPNAYTDAGFVEFLKSYQPSAPATGLDKTTIAP